MVGTFTKAEAKFILVIFEAEKSGEKIYWWPKHNSHITLTFNLGHKAYELDTFRFEYPYSNKYAEKKQILINSNNVKQHCIFNQTFDEETT